MRELQATPRLPGGQHADPRVGAAVAPVGSLGPVQGQHVHRRVREPAVQPQADELPGIDVHLPLAPALVPRPAAALQRVRPAPPQRALGHAQRPDPRPPVHPGRRAPVRPPGPAAGRDPGAPRRGARGVRLVRPRAALRVRDQAGQGARRSGAVGARRAAHPRGVRRGRHHATTSSPRTGRSTRPRSTSTSTTRSGASGRWRPSRSTS